MINTDLGAGEPMDRAEILDVFPLPIWRSGLDGEYDYCNRAWRAFTGGALEQELSSIWAEGVHPGDLDRCRSAYRGAFKSREPFELRYRLRRHDGEYRTVIDFGGPFEDPAGNFAGYMGALVDDTERLEKEQQLFAAEKMEAVGRLAEGVAHDFSNLLVAITGYSSMLLDDIPKWDARHTHVAQIQRAADRAAVLTRQLLAFSSQHVMHPRPLDLDGVIRSLEGAGEAAQDARPTAGCDVTENGGKTGPGPTL